MIIFIIISIYPSIHPIDPNGILLATPENEYSSVFFILEHWLWHS